MSYTRLDRINDVSNKLYDMTAINCSADPYIVVDIQQQCQEAYKFLQENNSLILEALGALRYLESRKK